MPSSNYCHHGGPKDLCPICAQEEEITALRARREAAEAATETYAKSILDDAPERKVALWLHAEATAGLSEDRP